MKRWKSIAVWPKGTCPFSTTPDMSEDTHFTAQEAHGVCLRLNNEGFGGDGYIFPLSTKVEEITE